MKILLAGLRLFGEIFLGRRKNLSGRDLSGRNLSGRNLRGADLREVDLRDANLGFADLRDANLWRADLRRADLWEADLRGADLLWAIFLGADLRGANLSGVDLTGAELQGVDLRWANLQWVNLQGANLRNARFYGVNLTGAILPEGHQICPPVGTEFPGWKKRGDDAIVKLLIPSTAERCNGIGSRKCRASEAVVVGVTGGDGSRLSGTHNKGIEYLEGMTVTPDKYDGDIRVSCTNGIHFFLTEREAQEFR